MKGDRKLRASARFVPLLAAGVVAVISVGLNPAAAPAGETGHQHQMGGQAHMASPARPIAVPAAFRESLTPVYRAYFNLHHALSNDDLAGARQAFSKLGEAVVEAGMGSLEGKAHHTWMGQAEALKKKSAAGAAAQDLALARERFAAVSATVIAVDKSFGHAGNGPHFVLFCPMALGGKGASWLQASEEASNPYMGSKMKRCGEVKERLLQ